jgi:hypothetical protein
MPESNQTLSARDRKAKLNNAPVASRRVEITVERELLSVYYHPGSSYHGPCPSCGRDVLMLTAEAASVAIGVTRRQIYRALDENKFHFHESPSGDTYVCSVSIDPSGLLVLTQFPSPHSALPEGSS